MRSEIFTSDDRVVVDAVRECHAGWHPPFVEFDGRHFIKTEQGDGERTTKYLEVDRDGYILPNTFLRELMGRLTPGVECWLARLCGHDLFVLRDTYGLPVEMVETVLRKRWGR